MMPSLVPLLAVLVPALAVVPIVALRRWPNLRDASSVVAGVLALGTVIGMLPATLDGAVPTTVLFDFAPGVAIALAADAAGLLFALVASSLWVVTTFYSIGYMRSLGEGRQSRYYAAFAVSVASAIGVALAGNLVTFVLFYELLTLATYPLVTHHGDGPAIAGGRKYLAYTLSAGLALIAGSAWLVALGVDTTFRAGGFLGALADRPATLWALFALLAAGVGVKAAVMPLHSWLPSAMVAPTPVSALLHAVAVVKAGAFGFVRVMGFVFGPALLAEMGAAGLVAVLAGGTILIGSLMALRMDHLKQRLAYSTISHLSYIVLGTALATPAAWTGALLHMAAHGVTKITLFFCAGSIHAGAHKDYVSELRGIGWRMPWTMSAFALASLGMAGLPPFMMFASKWYLGTGAVLDGHPGLMLVYVASGVLNAAYLFPIVFRAFAPVRPSEHGGHGDPHGAGSEASPFIVVPLVVTGVMALVLGIFPNAGFHLLDLAREAAAAVAALPEPATTVGIP
jgi:multicomponent Na+:H+ antiporter subunit D